MSGNLTWNDPVRPDTVLPPAVPRVLPAGPGDAEPDAALHHGRAHRRPDSGVFPRHAGQSPFHRFPGVAGPHSDACATAVPWDRLPYPSFLAVPFLDFVSIASGPGGRPGQPDGHQPPGRLSRHLAVRLRDVSRSRPWPCHSSPPWASSGCRLFIRGDVSGQDLARSLLLPVMMLGIGVSVSVLTLSMVRQQTATWRKRMRSSGSC